LNIKLKF